MNHLLKIYLIAPLIIVACNHEKLKLNTDTINIKIDTTLINLAISNIESQFSLAIINYPNPEKTPRSLDQGGNIEFNTFHSGIHWTVGFFPGSLWYIYELTGKEEWEEKARKWTSPLEKIKNYTYTHDLGFIMYCSYGNGNRLTDDENYKQILIQSAKSLKSRYNDKIMAIKSHDYAGYKFPVIIDNMMNLELLFWATKATGDSTYYYAAKNHAYTTMKHHFRSNMSVYQFVDFNISNGDIRKKGNTQGYNNESEWTRGQAWALYGFTMCYRETKDPVFLAMAENIADYLLNNSDMSTTIIPKWDLMAPNLDNEPYDASSGAIIASALIELYNYSNSHSDLYKNKALLMLTYLSSQEFLSAVGGNNFFLLKHSVGSYPINQNVDVPIVYADYYYLEALKRYTEIFHN